MEMNLNTIKELVDYLNQSGVDKFHLETKDFKLSLEKSEVKTVESAALSVQPEKTTVAASVSQSGAAQAPAPAAAPCDIVKAPIVGTFYASSAPEKPPFVKVGQQVKKGDTLFIIESMKLMNEIASEVSGTVAEIMLESGSPVEYGQPVMRIEV